MVAERHRETREGVCLRTESGLRCRFLSGKANLWRLENNLVMAVGGCWEWVSGGEGLRGDWLVGEGGGRVLTVSLWWKHAWHSIPFQLMWSGLQDVNPPLAFWCLVSTVAQYRVLATLPALPWFGAKPFQVYGRNQSFQPWEGRLQYTTFFSIMSTLADCNTVRQYDRPAVQSSEAVMVIWKFDHHMPDTLYLREFWRVNHISWTICPIWITQ